MTSSGVALAGVEVCVVADRTNRESCAQTNGAGEYATGPLVADLYTVEASGVTRSQQVTMTGTADVVADFAVGGVVEDVDDVQAPNTVIDSPGEGERVSGPGVVVAGSAFDNVGISEVRIAVRDNETGEWLRRDGSFGSFSLLPTALDRPGAASTDWSASLDLPAGIYQITAFAGDLAGNDDPTRARADLVVS